MKLTIGKLAALGATAAMLAALAGPAAATNGSGPVNVTLTTAGPTGGRTLTLLDNTGNSLAGVDLSSGTNSFVAKVIDSNYAEKGFTVQATMSNLYAFSNGTYNCSSKVASSAVSMATANGLEISGLGATVTPNFILGGTLPVGVPGTLTSANDQIQGVAQSLNPTQLVGNAGSLYGATLAGLLTKLPISVSTPAGGPFSNPDADPAGASCGVAAGNATPVTMMTGTANAAGLLSDFTTVLTSAVGANPTLATLVSDGYLDPNAVTSLLLGITGLPLDVLTPQLSTIEGALTGALSGVTPLVTSVTSQSGTYSSNPGVAINTSGVPAGSYKGVMTITLMDS